MYRTFTDTMIFENDLWENSTDYRASSYFSTSQSDPNAVVLSPCVTLELPHRVPLGKKYRVSN